MKQKIKKAILATLFCLVIISWLIPSANSLDAETTLEYKDYDLVTLTGNVTLSFVLSETGSNDLDVKFSTYVFDGSNITGTVYLVVSEEITTDWHFVNDTKIYIFKDQNDKLYRFDVDYSSMPVPSDLELVETKINLSKCLIEIDLLNNETWSLNENISILEDNKITKEELYNLLDQNYSNLNFSFIQLEHDYQAQIDVNELLLNQSGIVAFDNGYLTLTNENLENEINILTEEKNNPIGFAIYPVMLCMGAVGLWQFQNYRNGKGVLGKPKITETHFDPHSDSAKINEDTKKKIQLKKQEQETKKQEQETDPAEVVKTVPFEYVSKDIDDLLSKFDKTDLEIV